MTLFDFSLMYEGGCLRLSEYFCYGISEAPFFYNDVLYSCMHYSKQYSSRNSSLFASILLLACQKKRYMYILLPLYLHTCSME